MTNRKPPGTDWESWVDAVIRESRDRGEFDNLPGSGKPIEGLDRAQDELWWVRKKLKDEGISYLPPTLALRKDREDTLASIDSLASEARVRQLLEELNERIRAVNRRPVQGPPSTVVPLEVDEVIARWRRRRVGALADPPLTPPPTPEATPTGMEPRQRRWWLRRAPRHQHRRP